MLEEKSAMEHIDMSFMQVVINKLCKKKKVLWVKRAIFKDSTIVLLTLECNNVLNVKKLEMKFEDIAYSIKNYFMFSTDQVTSLARGDRNKVVRKQKRLVKKLKQFMNDDDLIVLCSPSKSHLIFIHALEIEKTCLMI